jgi:Domain of unknown function (DUF4296)
MRCTAVFLLLLFFSSCSNRTGIPGDIIPPDSMRKIMKDIIEADQYSTQFIARDSMKRDKVKASQDLMEVIFKIHHTTRAEFKTSLNFYESRPDLNKKIFDSLMADANRRKPELYLPKPVIKTGKTPEK